MCVVVRESTINMCKFVCLKLMRKEKMSTVLNKKKIEDRKSVLSFFSTRKQIKREREKRGSKLVYIITQV